MHSPTQSSMPAHSIATAAALLTIVALGCILVLSVLFEGNHDQRLRPISSRRTFRGTKTIDQVRQLRPVAFMRNIAHGRRLANNEDLDISANYGNKQGHQKPALSLALVRPISVRDADALVNSFVYWDEFAPSTNKGCRSSRGTQSASIDIIISFSREFDKQKYPDISEAMGTVHSLFEKTNGWGGCIQSVKMFEARIHPEEDLYDPLLAEQGNRMWANGPNRQFERTFRYVRSLDKYDAMFLMESDTYPTADGWLDLLTEEVKSSAPFALLGSKYNGHAWDDFAEQMPLALLHHINGNAIYNTTHPLLEHIVLELEDEADTWYNAITYDYRISQILLEGSSGASPDFPYTDVVEDGNRIKLQPKTEKFNRWWKEYPDTYELVQESKFMTNLGSTAFLPGDVEDGIALVHGKNMYLPWNSSIHGNLSLVVSDWGEMDEPYKEFLSKLNAIDHPYSEIILMASLESEEIIYNVSKWSNSTINLPLVIQNRTHDEATDLCNAEPTTDYFMLTDVGHAPREEKVEVMVASDGSNRPVIPFVSSESVHCSSYKSCNTVIQEARQHYDRMDRFIFSDEMLFRKDLLQDYCRELRGQKNSAIISNGNTDDRLVAPSATGYIAFLHGIEVVDSHYAFSDIVVEGSRRNFVPVDPKMPPSLKYHTVETTHSSKVRGSDLPVLWHIPKSGGTTMESTLSYCRGLTVASARGAALERRRGNLRANDLPHSLRVVTNSRGGKYLTTDLSSTRGISVAGDLDLIGSGLADLLVTPLLTDMTGTIFSSESGRQARIFSIFRHPVDRAVSLFYYLQSATWEPTFDPSLQNMTIEEYAKSAKAESNWMVRMLNDEPAVVDERHLEIAKDILQQKVLIGLTLDMEESAKRFYSYFDWTLEEEGGWNLCERCMLSTDSMDSQQCRSFSEYSNSNIHREITETSKAWDLLSAKNALDVALYEYAVELFHRQGAMLFEPNSFSPANSLAHQLTRNSDVVDDEVHQLLDEKVGRQLESNVADGGIVSFRNPSLSCSGITNSNACAGRQNCVWKESSKICESDIFGHSAKVEYRSNAMKKCSRMKSQRKMLRCFKVKKRRCRAIENRRRRLKCVSNQKRSISHMHAKARTEERRMKVRIKEEQLTPQLYYCGGEGYRRGIALSIFPEIITDRLNLTEANVQNARPNDILVVEKFGGTHCPQHLNFDSYLYRFPGIQLHFNSEPYDIQCLNRSPQNSLNPYPQCPNTFNYIPPSDRVFVFGPRKVPTPRTMKLTYLQRIAHYRFRESYNLFIDASQRPRNTKKFFLLYAASHYIHFREEAAKALLERFGTIHTAGECQGNPLPGASDALSHFFGVRCRPLLDDKRVVEAPMKDNFTTYWDNDKLFHDYRFVLVMENTKLDGYISEKILLAFLAGTVPIYYGTKEVFDIFNKDAFIYYDIENPNVAMDRIEFLERNPSEYNKVLQQPIFASGAKTLEEYFSFSDSIGEGKLKEKIRRMVGFSDIGVTYRAVNTPQGRNAAAESFIRTPQPQSGSILHSPTIPLHMLQFGPPRTATTLQFQTICLSMFKALLSGNHTALLGEMECKFTGGNGFVDKKPMVLKTHKLNEFSPTEIGQDTWFFATSRPIASAAKLQDTYDDWRSKGYNIRYVQDVAVVSDREHLISLEYQEMFSLSDDHAQDIIDYLRQWDILRRCCGVQMSKHWRAYLVASEQAEDVEHSSPIVNLCLSHDIDSVERAFMTTNLYQELKSHPKLQLLLSPSEVDGALDGTYCARYNKYVKKTGAAFGQRMQ